jgi:hypothetical protein
VGLTRLAHAHSSSPAKLEGINSKEAFMSVLNTAANFHHSGSNVRGDFEPGDAFYEALMQAHEGLSDDQSQLLNARLILLLANHIGDLQVLLQAIDLAKLNEA